MATKFTNSDVATLLAQPGYFYYRTYGSSNPWTKAVFANGASYSPSTESAEIAFEDVGTVREEVANETAEITISSGRVLDPEFIYDLTGGLYTKEVLAGTPVAGAEQTIASGNWNYENLVLIEGHNSDGSKPTINSVTGGTDGALVLGTDYDLAKLPEAGWAIYFISGGNISTEAQDVVVDYDYTPAGETILKRGGIKVIEPLEIAFQTTDEDGDYVQFIFYKAYSNGADGHGFSPENEVSAITMDLTFTAKKDVNRDSGDQLMRKVFKASASL
jgi:hypothetical protein